MKIRMFYDINNQIANKEYYLFATVYDLYYLESRLLAVNYGVNDEDAKDVKSVLKRLDSDNIDYEIVDDCGNE